jgi:hypothetical protein
VTDPFAAPAAIPSSFPTVASFRGRLVLIRPTAQQTVPNNLGAPGSTQERVTADITVVDGLGPVPQMKGNPPTPTGQMFQGPDFPGTYVQSEVIVKQLADAVTSRGLVLARIDTRQPGTQPMKGNPWGLIDPTEEDKQTARNFLATRTIGAASAPAPQQNAAPVYVQQTPVQAQILAQGAPAPAAYVPPAAPPQLPVPGSAPAGVNPFA